MKVFIEKKMIKITIVSFFYEKEKVKSSIIFRETRQFFSVIFLTYFHIKITFDCLKKLILFANKVTKIFDGSECISFSSDFRNNCFLKSVWTSSRNLNKCKPRNKLWSWWMDFKKPKTILTYSIYWDPSPKPSRKDHSTITIIQPSHRLLRMIWQKKADSRPQIARRPHAQTHSLCVFWDVMRAHGRLFWSSYVFWYLRASVLFVN